MQFADLRVPGGEAPASGFPVIVFLHGGAWRAKWSKDYGEAFVEELADEGFATWDVEYRRLGHPGGGYPGTFEDVADALDHLRALVPKHPLDLSRVIAVGHSSGGHLALWLAGRRHMAESGPLYRENPLPLRGVISLAGVNDLELSLTLGDRRDVLELAGVDSLDGGREQLDQIDPGRLLPLGVPLILYIGDKDSDWRLEMTNRFEDKARKAGDTVTTIIVSGANHMDVTDAGTGFSQLIAQSARELLQVPGS
ncbi:MAG: alpha/beta hydrolase [Xanthomonadales bacterium]|nr:alpha/beta hydrolase [Xanthomonadales bacterium]